MPQVGSEQLRFGPVIAQKTVYQRIVSCESCPGQCPLPDHEVFTIQSHHGGISLRNPSFLQESGIVIDINIMTGCFFRVCLLPVISIRSVFCKGSSPGEELLHFSIERQRRVVVDPLMAVVAPTHETECKDS